MVGTIFVDPNGVYVLQRSRGIEKRQSWMISRNYQLCSTFLRWWSHLQEELCWGKTRNLLIRMHVFIVFITFHCLSPPM